MAGGGAAILAGVKYGEERGAVVFEPTDSASEKILFIYRLPVDDFAPLGIYPDSLSWFDPCYCWVLWQGKARIEAFAVKELQGVLEVMYDDNRSY